MDNRRVHLSCGFSWFPRDSALNAHPLYRRLIMDDGSEIKASQRFFFFTLNSTNTTSLRKWSHMFVKVRLVNYSQVSVEYFCWIFHIFTLCTWSTYVTGITVATFISNGHFLGQCPKTYRSDKVNIGIQTISNNISIRSP